VDEVRVLMAEEASFNISSTLAEGVDSEAPPPASVAADAAAAIAGRSSALRMLFNRKKSHVSNKIYTTV
jgi:hypothetical protein